MRQNHTCTRPAMDCTRCHKNGTCTPVKRQLDTRIKGLLDCADPASLKVTNLVKSRELLCCEKCLQAVKGGANLLVTNMETEIKSSHITP